MRLGALLPLLSYRQLAWTFISRRCGPSRGRKDGQGQPRHSSGHHENSWSEVHPEANLRDHYRSTTALCQQETHAPQQTTALISLYSVISSVRASRVGGMIRPILPIVDQHIPWFCVLVLPSGETRRGRSACSAQYARTARGQIRPLAEAQRRRANGSLSERLPRRGPRGPHVRGRSFGAEERLRALMAMTLKAIHSVSGQSVTLQ
jgi:hypothetical protein